MDALKEIAEDHRIALVEGASRRVLSLPVHPLVTKDDITYMINVLKEIS